MIRVVVTGSECTGKTTLAAALAGAYGVPWLGEYARRFVTEKGAPPERDDVEAIARGQVAGEDALIAESLPLVIQDTDLLSTMVYSRHYYGACPSWIEDELARRKPDLYLLAGIDVPWIPDGDLRDRPYRRDEMQELFRNALRELGSDFEEVSGSPGDRLALARSLLDPLIDGHGKPDSGRSSPALC